jgi:hypothetical protein
MQKKFVHDHRNHPGPQRFTHLFARITEEEDCYFLVQVRLLSGAMSNLEGAVSAEEIAESIETAAEMVATLAERFSISQDRITLEIRMADIAENTRH